MLPIGVGIVGTGRISDLHAIEYLRTDAARIVAVCDRAGELAAAKAAQWGAPAARVFGALEELLACNEVDLVEVLLPHELHATATLAALAAGKAVSLQKPVATCLADANAMVTAAEATGAVLQGVRELRLLPAGAEGQGAAGGGGNRRALDHPDQERVRRPAPRLGHPRQRPGLAARSGALRRRADRFDDGHHKFVLAWWFMGMPDKVHAWIGRTAVAGGTVDGPAMISYPLPRQPDGRVRGGARARPARRHAPLRPGRPDRNHRQQRRGVGDALTRAPRRPAVI